MRGGPLVGYNQAMCGRFFRRRPRDELAAAFRASPFGEDLKPGYNIPPGQLILAARFNGKTGERTLEPLSWGLIPHFATDRKIAFKLSNARAETVDTLASFRTAFAKRRCIVAADGFYEWLTRGKSKHPFAFARADFAPLAIAGVWENWQDPATGEWIRSCALITTAANALVAQVHDRMPVILEPWEYSKWLGEEPCPAHDLKRLLRPLPPESMVSWPVSSKMNSPKVDDVSVLDPVENPLDELRL